MPNVNELESLVHAGEPNPGTWLNTQGFSNVQLNYYWSSTTFDRYEYFAWRVNMWTGHINADRKYYNHYVWPVRGGDMAAPAKVPKTGQTTSYAPGDDGDLKKGVAWPSPRFTDNGDGTVTDNLTGLIWLKDVQCFWLETWTDAIHKVNSLKTGECGLADGFGEGDWRLPNRKELRSLIDYSQWHTVLPAGHPFSISGLQSDFFWSSTTYAYNTNLAWGVDMRLGMLFNDIDANDKIYSYYVWPVRGGQSGAMVSAGIPGAMDKVPTSAMIVSFIEVGIDVATHSHDTLAVIQNISQGSVTIHYHVWDIDGNPTDLYGNVTLQGFETLPLTLRGLIDVAPAYVKSQLAQDSFYRGFMTIDTVSSATTLNPTQGGYPFSTANSLAGFIYYVRLLEGSSNGMSAIPIEYVGSSADPSLQDFYQNDDKEQIDSEARACAESLTKGGTCSPDDYISGIRSRVFLDPNYNASSRIIVFTWAPGRIGGPSVYCDTNPCPSTYTYRRYDEAGSTLQDTAIRLDHAVNVINVSGTQNGYVSIVEVPSGIADFQVFAFSINSANPPPSLELNANWDAIFESYIDP